MNRSRQERPHAELAPPLLFKGPSGCGGEAVCDKLRYPLSRCHHYGGWHAHLCRRRYPDNDPAAFETHLPRALATIARFGGRVIAGGGKIDLLEGGPMPERIFIIEFPTADALST